MLTDTIVSFISLAKRLKRIKNSDLPSSMRRELARAIVRLDFPEDHKLRNPVSLMGFKVSYWGANELRYLFRELFENGSYLFHTDVKQPLILDCGSNIGMSVLFFKKIYPHARIIAFEPDPATFATLTTNVAQNSLKDVTLHQCALTSVEGIIDFYRSNKVVGSLMMSVNKERSDGEKIVVPARRLSSFIEEQVNLLKMDIEGAEESVLTELAASGKLHMIDQIHLEYHHHLRKNTDKLSLTLKLLEDQGFGYQLGTKSATCCAPEAFQDISIYCYRKH